MASGPERISGRMKTLEGSMTALATPFRDGALDEAAYRALVRQQLAGGTVRHPTRRTPSLRISARNPPQPLSAASAPGPNDWSIQ